LLAQIRESKVSNTTDTEKNKNALDAGTWT
jgi:hypothetical protein